MMTIKEFANLCSCNAQTLRYYDKIDLLKPVKVDQWSGYRYYTKSQAIDFVKIKNLQAADFTIEEIKVLLTKSDRQVYEAFNIKIAEQEQKLERIIQIQQSYLKEKNSMEKIIQGLSDFLLRQLSDFEMLREFGLRPEDGPEIVKRIRAYIEERTLNSLQEPREVTLILNGEKFQGADQVAHVIFTLDEENLSDTILLGDENVSEKDVFDPSQYESLWERHGWEYVHEFIDDIPKMEAGADHCFYFRLNEEKYRENVSFPLFMIGAMILRGNGTDIHMGCSVDRSEDAQNHFILMHRK